MRIRVEENFLNGLTVDQKESVEHAIEEIEYRIPRPRVGMTEVRTHTMEFGPPSR